MGKFGENLINTLGEDHRTENVLQIGDGFGLNSDAKIMNLLLSSVVLLLDSLALFSAVGPRPIDDDRPLLGPSDLENPRSLVSDP